MDIDLARSLAGSDVRVLYQPQPIGAPEEGVITSVGAGTGPMVFVRYDGDTHAKATRPQDLRLAWSSTCSCPPCPGCGNDGHGLTHCAECCFGTGVLGDPECPRHGADAP